MATHMAIRSPGMGAGVNPATRHAEAFLRLLKEANPSGTHICARTFDDVKNRKDVTLARKINGPLNNINAQLQQLNGQGAGIFVVINEGGQTTAEITKIIAVFADTDGAPLEPLLCLQPHIVVESSPGRWHVYWLVEGDFPLEQFKPIQKAIATKFGTDLAVCDLPRVMRLPGFYHHKADPFPVRIIQYHKDLPRYSMDEIVAGLGLNIRSNAENFDLGKVPEYLRGFSSNAGDLGYEAHSPLEDVTKMLRHINPGCSREQWVKVGFALADEYGEAGRDLFVSWSAGELTEEQK